MRAKWSLTVGVCCVGWALLALGCGASSSEASGSMSVGSSGGGFAASSSAAMGGGTTSQSAASGGSRCEGPCAVNDLTLKFGSQTVQFSRSQYGLTAPAQAGSEDWEIYLEAHEGGAPNCPSRSSPTPDYTLILAGLPAATPSSVMTEADGLRLTLLDFEGSLLGNAPLSKAESVRVTPTMANVCTACVGVRGHQAGYVALAMEATFAEGTLTGHSYATHCQSLDQP